MIARCHECSMPFLKLQDVTAERGPEPGDPVICGHCGAIGYLEENHYTCMPTEADIRHWRNSQPGHWRLACEIRDQIRSGI